MIRFGATDVKYYAVVHIGAALKGLPLRHRYSLHADVDGINLGLLSAQMRRALATEFPLKFDYAH